MKFSFNLCFLAASLWIVGTVERAATQTSPAPPTWGYRLLEGSTLIDDCLICGRPTIPWPLRGTFQLVLLEDAGTVTRYAVSNIWFAVGSGTNIQYRVTGQGSYTILSPVGVSQQMTLQTWINDSTNGYVFTNDTNAPGVMRNWPMIAVSLVETQRATLVQTYYLDLVAAPVRETWFSTVSGLTSASRQPPTNRISAGDLLSDSGRVVRSNSQLLGKLGLMPGFGGFGIDAVDIGAGGEICFSLNDDVFSETLGQIQHGDLLSDRGAVFRKNQELMAAFSIQPPNRDVGLDAVQVMTNGEIYFSITTNVVSEKIGAMLFRGDVLSDRGRIVRTGQQLLARFHPNPVDGDFGLDALYVWPGGEVWFSTETGFTDTQLGSVHAGDLLSDQGFIVFRNLELVSAFAPVEDAADFGLDALYVVSDTIPLAPGPRILTGIPQDGRVSLQWNGPGRVFQVEKADNVSGPFLPLSPILPDSSWIDGGGLPAASKAFYRLRQW